MAKNCTLKSEKRYGEFSGKGLRMKPFYENKDSAVQAFEAIDMRFPEHLHDHVEILLVREGSINVRIMEKEQELQAGDCAVIFPQQIHGYHTPEKSRTILYIFEDSLSGRYMSSIQKCSPSHPFLSGGELPADASLALDRLYALSGAGQEERAENAEALCSAWIQVLFALIWPQLALKRRAQPEGTDLIYQIVQYIAEHFQEPLTLAVLANKLHVNKYYISHIFSQRLRINFRQYLNHIRTEYAMQLIRAGSAPLVDIWVEAGFNSQRSFNRVFMEIAGMTPGAYRRAAEGSGSCEKRSETDKT